MKVGSGGMACALVLTATLATAVDYTWTGNEPADQKWSSANNWNPATVLGNPIDADRLIFTTTDTNNTVPKVLGDIPDWNGTTPTNSWRIGHLRVTNTSGRHLLDLDGNHLHIVNDLYVQRSSGSAARLVMSGGGTCTIGRDVLVNQGHLVFGDTTIARHPTLDRTIRTLTAGTSGGSASVDLRGTTIAGGVLDLTTLSIGVGRAQGIVYIDNTTAMHTLRVTGTTRIHSGQHASGRIGYQDPDRGNNWYLPTGLNLVFGDRPAGDAGRGQLDISVELSDYIDGTGRLAVGGGGTFDGWLSLLRVGHNQTPDQNWIAGTLDLRGLDAFDLDATQMQVGTRWGSHSRVSHGYVYFPAGTARVDRLYMGDDVVNSDSILDLSGTVLQIDDYLNLKDRSTRTRLTVRVLGTASGLDLAAAATITTAGIGTPKIYFRFEEAPAVSPAHYWALRQAGNRAVTLGGLVDSGLIEMSMHFEGTEDYKAVVYYDSDSGYTYAGLVDVDATMLPAIEAGNRTVEVGVGQDTLRIGPNDLLVGVYNPDGFAETGRTLSHPDFNGGADQPYIDFPTGGSLPATFEDVTVKVLFEGDIVTADTAAVTFTAGASGVTANLTWEGRAGIQFDARREWQWGLNWAGDAPPANPTTGTLTFEDIDTDAVVPKELAPIPAWSGSTPTNVWQIGSLRAGNNAGWHRLDLNGKTLRTTGQLLANRLGSGTARMVITNGTLAVGTNLRVHNNSTLDLSGMGGTPLGIGNNLEVRSGGTLTLDGGVVLPSRFERLDVGYSSTATLDLRGTPVSGGVLNVDALVLGGAGGGNTGTLYLDAATLHSLIVSNTVHLNAEGQRGGANIGAPNPARGNAWFLPPGVNLRFGAVDSPAELIVGYSHDWTGGGFGRLAADAGGTCEAWLSLLTVGWATGGNETAGHSQLLLADMDAVTLSAATVNIGVGDAGRTPKGTVTLPPGTATVGTMTMGHANANASSIARLDLNDTRLTLTGTLTMFNRAVINVSLSGERAAGLELPALPALPDGASVNISFAADPVHDERHYGLKIPGNVVDALLAADWLSVDDDALTGRKVEIFSHGGDTYVGVPPPAGYLLLIR